jgi:periplasmic divalent cation tolerance protein
MSEALLIYTTWPDEESARRFAGEAVEAGLAACANILAPMTSVYRWRGAVEQAIETPMLLKTTRPRVEALRAAFVERHPYETPAFVALPVEAENCFAPYLQWLAEETASATG